MAQAIIEEGAMLHVECAIKRYGEAIIDIVTENVSRDAADELSAEDRATLDTLTFAEGDEDSESSDNAFADECGEPNSCDACLGYLVEDTRPAEYPLARDIMNLSVAARDPRVTRMLSQFGQYVRGYDSSPATILERIRDYPIFLDDTPLENARNEAATLAREWRDKQANVTPLVLHRDEKDALRDVDGNAWYEYDMRGYLDRYNDGQAECDGCGRGIVSHCFYDELDTEVRCPECVDIA